jgi:Transmembrane domain of unknown function (DUF3566)
VASRREGSESWWTEAEPSSASGGHVTPDVGSRSFFDPLTDPLPTYEPSRRDEPRTVERQRDADVLSREELSDPGRYDTQRGRYRGRRIRPSIRRVKRTVRHIDPFSVLKLSLFLYSCFLILWLIFVAFLYSVLSSIGVFDAIESIGAGFVIRQLQNFEISLFFVEKWAFFIGLTLLLVSSLVNVFLAFLYNLAADTVGGLEMTFVERES